VEDGVDPLDTETDWMAYGNCAHRPPSLFFPSDGVGVEVARRICADCPVKEPCLEYALLHRIDHGVWGGCSERERRRILKRRREEAAQATKRTAKAEKVAKKLSSSRTR
jgi:WhiB family redox-sensing transcriptional regulator